MNPVEERENLPGEHGHCSDRQRLSNHRLSHTRYLLGDHVACCLSRKPVHDYSRVTNTKPNARMRWNDDTYFWSDIIWANACSPGS